MLGRMIALCVLHIPFLKSSTYEIQWKEKKKNKTQKTNLQNPDEEAWKHLFLCPFVLANRSSIKLHFFAFFFCC